MTLLQLMYEFFITGLFSIGGGLAALPFLYKIAEKYPWFDVAIIPDMVAISESTPGPIGINMATYAGFNAAGLLGALLATICLALPSFLIIVLISKPLHKVKDSPVVKSALYLLRPAVTGLIAFSCWQVMRITFLNADSSSVLSLFNWISIAVFAIVWFLNRKFKFHPIVFIVACGILGILLQL